MNWTDETWFLTSIGSSTKRLLDQISKLTDSTSDIRSSEMDTDIDIIASLINIPKSIFAISISTILHIGYRNPASPSFEARNILWPLIFGIQTKKDEEKLIGVYFSLLHETHLCAGLACQYCAVGKTKIGESNQNITLIEKDVNRTDVNFLNSLWSLKHPTDNNQIQRKLCRILALYTKVAQAEYVQGMSDILSPIFASLSFNEPLSFWAFVGLLTGNPVSAKLPKMFDVKVPFSLFSFYCVIDSNEMKKALWTIGQLLRLLSPSLYSHLSCYHLDPLLVCYRWLLVWFKREFSFEDTCRLWEVASYVTSSLFFVIHIVRPPNMSYLYQFQFSNRTQHI